MTAVPGNSSTERVDAIHLPTGAEVRIRELRGDRATISAVGSNELYTTHVENLHLLPLEQLEEPATPTTHVWLWLIVFIGWFYLVAWTNLGTALLVLALAVGARAWWRHTG